MKLPNCEAAILDIEKLRDYCLSLEHPRGRHKARVFLSRLDLAAAQAEEFRAALLDAARNENAALGASDRFGTRYIIGFELGRGPKAAVIQSCWIVRDSETAPRFVTCFVL
jgi:hypothetical protein